MNTIPPSDDVVLGSLLDRRAEDSPDAVFVVYEDGTEWTYADTAEIARASAEALWALGVRRGDRVLVWLPNGADALRTWFGANLIGAVFVPINTAYRGPILEHVLRSAGSRLLVASSDLVERLVEVDVPGLERVVLIGGAHPAVPLDAVVSTELADPGTRIAELADLQPWDLGAILYTSGTTGASKGVLSSYMHLFTNARVAFDGVLTGDDRYMVQLPLFHIGGVMGVYGMLVRGGSIALVDGFRTRSFWSTARSTGSTFASLLGVMASFLWKEAPTPEDGDSPLRLVCMTPLIPEVDQFRARFNLDVFTLFNATELSVPLRSEINPSTPGYVGRIRDGVEVRVVDEHDRELEPGVVGELIVRTETPWTMTHGYDGRPDVTAETWRNGWFHTGDAMYRTEEDAYFFVERLSDTIRRRGENVSSFEVETQACAIEGVLEAVAVAVPSEFGEDEILLVVAPQEDTEIEPSDLGARLEAVLPRFMVPRFIRVVDSLPKTSTSKVMKVSLRDEGVTSDTWDRDRADG